MFFSRLERDDRLLRSLRKKIEQLMAERKWKKARKLQQSYKSYKMDTTLVHIFFKDLGVVKYSREELYGIMDVIGRSVKTVELRSNHEL